MANPITKAINSIGQKLMTEDGKQELFKQLYEEEQERAYEEYMGTPLGFTKGMMEIQRSLQNNPNMTKTLGRMYAEDNYVNKRKDQLINNIYEPRDKLNFVTRNKLFIDSAIWRSVIYKLCMEESRNGIIIKKTFERKCMKQYKEPCDNVALHKSQLKNDGETKPCPECPKDENGEPTQLPFGQEECGEEYNTQTKRCSVCGFPTRPPDIDHKRKLRKLKRKPVNRYGHTLETVKFQQSIDKQKHDNGFLVVDAIYKKSNDGLDVEILPETIDLLRGDPALIRPILSLEHAKLGAEYYTCVKHRKVFKKVENDKPFETRLNRGTYDLICEETPEEETRQCGWPLKQVKYVLLERELSNTPRYCFIEREVMHEKQYSPATPMGVSPGDSLFYHIIGLIGQEQWIAEYYLKRRMFKGILFLPPNMGSGESVQQMMQQHFVNMREDRDYIPVIGVPKEGQATYLRIDDTPKELQLIETRQESRREIANFYGVMNAWMSDTSTGTGLNNQGLDMAIMNRVVEWTQRISNQLTFLPMSALYVGCAIHELEYYLEYEAPEEQDKMAEIQRKSAQIANADAHQRIGGIVYQDANGDYVLTSPIEGQPLTPSGMGSEGGMNSFGGETTATTRPGTQSKNEKKPFQDVEGVNEDGQEYDRDRKTMPFQGSPQKPSVQGSSVSKMNKTNGDLNKDCVSDKISILHDVHPDWDHDKVVAVAHEYCGVSKEESKLEYSEKECNHCMMNKLKIDSVVKSYFMKEQIRAPKDGVTIDGVFYNGGQFIKKEIVEKIIN